MKRKDLTEKTQMKVNQENTEKKGEDLGNIIKINTNGRTKAFEKGKFNRKKQKIW